MNFLEMRTVLFSFGISNLICMILMAVLWKQNRSGFAGLGFWLADFVLQFLFILMFPLRSIAPDLLTMTAGNAMVLGGTILLYVGLERFTGRRGPQTHNILLFAVFVVFHAYFVVVRPSLAIRSIAISLGLLAICSQSAWLMLWRVDRRIRPITRGVGYVFGGFCLISLARIAVGLESPPSGDFFRSNFYDTALLMAYQMLLVVLTLSLFLMVNRRLFADLERDHAARERAEEFMRLRLRLWEFSAGHPVNELLQKALDEIERISGSLIGFCHFVDEDQNSLSLQAWSTRTLQEFCKTEGVGLHYPVNQAGVWVDCIHQRRPVIHNDYASLPHRKGMPAGHAEVLRELVVPTMCDGKIVAVLGVGNKACDYDERDVEQVAYIADIIWSIVEQKRAEEHIRRLNGQLEQLAMTDDLTGLANRRAFFVHGGEELRRIQRHEAPLSLIMLDIDEFKNFNDTYGHDAGDQILQRVAEALRENTRAIDVTARLGGEEFAVLLPNTDVDDAVKLAERLMQAIGRKECVIQENQKINVTASMGVARYDREMPDLDSLLRSADTAMYQAKRQGRNRVVLHS